VRKARCYQRWERFVAPFYAQKDVMHDLSHVKRVLKTARTISKKYHPDNTILTYAAYFHGIDRRTHKVALTRFLESQGLQKREIGRILRVARESQKESRPRTVEGMILHDAHQIEGGNIFLVVKSLVTGLQRGDSLPQIIDYFDRRIDGRFKCCLPETGMIYSEKEKFARTFFHDLKKSL
jgi:uncharacterized protein